MTQLNDLIEALREELQQYGEMLARFDDAAANNVPDTAEDAPVWVQTFQEQQEVVELTLRRREQVQRRLADCLCLPAEAVLTEIIPLLPRSHQMVVGALMDENKELSARVQQRANQRRQLPQPSFDLTENRSVAA